MTPAILKFEKNTLSIITEDGNILFAGTEAAKALGYKNPQKAIYDHCKNRGVTKRSVPHPQSKNKTIKKLFITESNLYRLIAHSKLPSAEKFEAWIFEEVLPSIRKNGGYINPAANENQVKILLEEWKAERNQFTNTISQQAIELVGLKSTLNHYEKAISMVEPASDFGSISKNNGKTKIKFRRPTFYAPSEKEAQIPATTVIQCLLPLFDKLQQITQ